MQTLTRCHRDRGLRLFDRFRGHEIAERKQPISGHACRGILLCRQTRDGEDALQPAPQRQHVAAIKPRTQPGLQPLPPGQPVTEITEGDRRIRLGNDVALEPQPGGRPQQQHHPRVLEGAAEHMDLIAVLQQKPHAMPQETSCRDELTLDARHPGVGPALRPTGLVLEAGHLDLDRQSALARQLLIGEGLVIGQHRLPGDDPPNPRAHALSPKRNWRRSAPARDGAQWCSAA